MNSKIVIGAVGCLALLGACSSTQQRAQTQQPASTDFSRELARQYYGFSEQQRVDAYDYGSAGFFKSKGDTAAKGTVVPPETAGQRFTPRNAALRNELTAARSRLELGACQPGDDEGRRDRSPVPRCATIAGWKAPTTRTSPSKANG